MALRLSKTNKVLVGVCGGLAEFFKIDAVIIRILFICAFIFAGIGVIPYIVLWILMLLNEK